jgi:1-acyl-sn-glycerol-3-phosphate acyltransferase
MCEEFLRRPQGNLILYPEGTRSASGEIQTFKKGAGLFAVELGVPVVPAHIGGARNILPKGRFLPRLGTVTVRFGEPIQFASSPFDHLPARGLRNAAVELLEQRIRELGKKPVPEESVGLPEEGQPTTISVSAVAPEGQNTKSRRLSGMPH